MKAIVIGGGIGGLTAAIALGKVGIDAQVYERAPELKEVGAGIALAGNALRTLDALGIGSALRSQSFTGMQGGVWNPRGKALMSMPADQLTRQLGAVAVLHRAELLSLLAQRIDPERLHLGWECAGFEQDEEGVTARFADGEVARGHLLIGADGLRSAVRTGLAGVKAVRYAGYMAWRTVVELNHGADLVIGETWGRGRRFGIVPMSRGRIYWFATNNSPEGQRDPAGGSKQILSELFRGWHDPIRALIAAAKEGSILRNDIYDMDPLDHWVKDRVALLGDAAHPMTPNLGQGACQAIEDAVVLAACLARSEKVNLALMEYERRRIPRASQFVLRSRWLGELAQLENPALCWMRDTAVQLTPKWVAARQVRAPVEFAILSPAERDLFGVN